LSKKKEKSVGFTLRGVETKQFAVFPDLYKDSDEVMLLQKFDYGANQIDRMIGVFAEFRFTQNDIPFLSIQVLCHFEIEHDAWIEMINEENTAINVKPNLLGHLVMLAIGTTRGVLHAKTENKLFNQYLLPTLNVNDIVTEPTILEFT